MSLVFHAYEFFQGNKVDLTTCSEGRSRSSRSVRTLSRRAHHCSMPRGRAPEHESGRKRTVGGGAMGKLIIGFIMLPLLLGGPTALALGEARIELTPSSRLSAIPGDAEAGIQNRYLVNIEGGILRDTSAIRSISRSGGGVVRKSDASFEFVLANGEVAKLTTERLDEHLEGVMTYSGRVEGRHSGWFTLSVMGEQVDGHIRRGSLVYEVKFEPSSGMHLVNEIDPARMPRGAELEPVTASGMADSGGSQATQKARKSSGSNGNVRVLVYYTPRVQNRNNVSSMAANIISELNTSLSNSAVSSNVFFTLAGTRKINSNFAQECSRPDFSQPSSIYKKIKDRTGVFYQLDQHLEQYSADLVLTIVSTELSYSHCVGGWGRVGGIAGGILNSNYRWAITTDTYALGTLNALHEVGHVVGGNHEPSTGHGNASGTAVYAKGHVDSSKLWQTVMGGYNECPFVPFGNPQSCVRLNRWSNPVLTYQGKPTGVVGVSDMESGLELTAPIVANWYEDTQLPATAPSLITIPEFCFGLNSLSWNAVSHADSYQVFRSLSPAFTNPALVYSGSATLRAVVVAQGSPEYFKVKACNGNGCSGYSNQVSLTYYNGCK